MKLRTFFVSLAPLALSVALAACGSPDHSEPGGASSERGGRVDSARAHELVASGATLVDVRSEGEWASRHIEGAVLVPVDELDARLAEIPRDHPVVVYCASGGRSASAAATLEAEGYEVYDLGGIDRW